MAAPAMADTTMTFSIDVTGAQGVAGFSPTSFQETFTLGAGTLSSSGGPNPFGFNLSTDFTGAASGSDSLTAGLQSQIDLTGAADYSNYDLGTTFSSFFGNVSTGTEGDIFENLMALDGDYQQSIDGGSLSNYLPATTDEAGLAAFFGQVQPMAWYESVSDANFNVVAEYTGTATLVSFSGGAGAAPEPAEWALMLLGFGAMGAALRRRRTALPA
jgi:hypothetical protein